MRRLRFVTAVVAGLIVSSCAEGENTSDDMLAAMRPINQAVGAVEPKMVVQFAHQAPVMAVRWINAGRNLVSFAKDGTFVVWDIEKVAILDTGQLPGDWSVDRGSDLELQKIATVDDGSRLALFFRNVVRLTTPGIDGSTIKNSCPVAARREQNWCAFSFDLASRKVEPNQSDATPADNFDPGAADGAEFFPRSPGGRWRPMPNHHDGRPGLFDQWDENIVFPDASCSSIERCRYGVNLVSVKDPARIIKMTGDPRGYFLDGEVSNDGRRLVRVESVANDTLAKVEVLDLIDGSRQQPFETSRAYHRVTWIGDDRYLLMSEGYDATNDTPAALGGYPPSLLIDPDCLRRQSCAEIDSYDKIQPLDDGDRFIGLGDLASCYRGRFGPFCPDSSFTEGDAIGVSYLPLATGVSIYAPEGAGSRAEWKLAELSGLQGQTITAIKLSPDKRALAVATRQWDSRSKPNGGQTLRVLLFDIEDGAVRGDPHELLKIFNPLMDTAFNLDSINSTDAEGRPIDTTESAIANGLFQFKDEDTITDLQFTADGNKLVFVQGVDRDLRGGLTTNLQKTHLYIVDTNGIEEPLKIQHGSRRVIAVGSNRVFSLDERALIDISSGKTIRKLAGDGQFVRAGYIAHAKLIWATREDGAIEFWESRQGDKQLTLYLFPDNRFFAVAPGGRYDTNLAPDSDAIRWLVPDAPWQSLASQTFMRDFYEPELYRKLLDCRAANNCGEVFRQLPSIESRNRTLPKVRITSVTPGRDPSVAIVRVELSEGVDPDGSRSGVFNPRLFRNGRLVAMHPDADADADALEQWRERNNLTPGKDGNGKKVHEFTIPLPTAEGTDTQVFTAYAFNEDRIKGDTGSFTYTRPPVKPRAKRAFVITIGIDDYETERFRLNYAVADARLLAERLRSIEGFEMRRLTLAGEAMQNGQRRVIDKEVIATTFELLSSSDGRKQKLERLSKRGIDASMIEQSQPDDIVIVSFSGHGWADKLGNFYLVPSDGAWPDGSDAPAIETLFETAQTTRFFGAMQAAEITLIIDACHSAASVAADGFKPGPMGDSGLGQLAYDKGIRVLAATQADDVALEDDNLRQGLLTHALANEGITASGGMADLDGDYLIRLNEWLRYGVKRLPELSKDPRLGQLRASGSNARAVVFFDLAPGAARRRVQQPALFDFNAEPSSVILRAGLR